MNFLKSFLKKYSALILPAALVIVAFLLLLPSMMLRRGLAQDMQQSTQQSGELSRLVGQAPSDAHVEDASRFIQRYEQEAKTIEDAAISTTRRDLIQYGLFPNPGDSSSQVYSDFGGNFRAMVEDLIRELNAKDAPSQAEIQNQLGYSPNRPMGGMNRGGREMGGLAMGGTPYAQSQDEVLNAVCLQRAQEISVYAEPGVFPIYGFWESYSFPGRQQAIKDCWYSQLAYWIYEDVATTIKSMNAGSVRVDDSPVKRLLGVRFQGPVENAGDGRTAMLGRAGMGAASAVGMDQPIYQTGTQTGPFLAQSWTGRTGSEDIDVVHFAVSAVVDSRYLMSFYKELCSGKPHQYREELKADGKVVDARHNQITILESAVSAVDAQSPEHTYYRYGSAGVVRVDLVCEYLFYRAGYDTVKPEEVKTEIGQGEAGGDMQTGMTPGMPGRQMY